MGQDFGIIDLRDFGVCEQTETQPRNFKFLQLIREGSVTKHAEQESPDAH